MRPLLVALLGTVALLVPHAPPDAPVAVLADTAAPCALALQLTAGFVDPSTGIAFPYAPDIPAGPVDISVPLYPGAVPSSERFEGAAEGGPATTYIKEAAAEYVLPVTPMVAKGWYRPQFEQCGYWRYGHGWYRAGSSYYASNIDFAADATDNQHVELSFTALPDDRSLVFYFAYAVTYPPRPFLSFVPRDIVRVALTFKGHFNTPTVRRSVRSVPVVQRLISSVNSLRMLDDVRSFCPWDQTPFAILVFREADGRTMRVTENSCASLTVEGFRPFFDRGLRVWHVIAAAAASA